MGGANGFPLQPDHYAAGLGEADGNYRSQGGSHRPKNLPRAIEGGERFLRPTKGTASLSDVAGELYGCGPTDVLFKPASGFPRPA